jgi:hypothetical protein
MGDSEGNLYACGMSINNSERVNGNGGMSVVVRSVSGSGYYRWGKKIVGKNDNESIEILGCKLSQDERSLVLSIILN